MKNCTQCGLLKPLGHFYSDTRTRDGRKSECKACHNAVTRGIARAWYRDNPERHRALTRAWVLRHPRRAAFNSQKRGAKRRGIEFLLTLEEWIKWWGSDFELRGKQHDSLQMCRYGDVGPYKAGNIYMASKSENQAGPRPLPEPGW